jgi:tetratricopeptide (TPR) repeat protein
MKRALVGFGLLLALVLVAGDTLAGNTGGVRGQVRDDKLQGIEGVKLVMVGQGETTGTFEIVTNKKGEYVKLGIPTGHYKITASKDGYAPQYIEFRVLAGGATEAPVFQLVAAQGTGPTGPVVDEKVKAEFSKALELAQAGQYAEAEALYAAMLVKNPARPEVLVNLGWLALQRKDFAAAEDAYRKALEYRPEYTEALTGLSNALFNAGQKDQAIELLTKAAVEYPENARLPYQCGWLLFNMGRGADAEAYLTKSQALGNADPEILFLLGSIQIQKNQVPAGIALYEKYIAANPRNQQNLDAAKALIVALKPKK